MRHARILIGLGVLVLSAGGALANPAYVATTVNLRAAPGTTNEIVAKIPGGSLVDASDCAEGWCQVNWQGKSGFAIQTALDLSGRVPPRAAAAPGYAPRGPYPDEEIVYGAPPPPPVYYYGGPYYRPYWGWRRHW
ncbi:MAG TPA: SH3 domain-containing protein [Pseudolabrys sp.]|nr:SH3 domain-containing protein [Pseudolabrys sp.]